MSQNVVAENLSSNNFILHAGDFNNDGSLDILHQAKKQQDKHGITLNNGFGQFDKRLQEWANGHLGLNWDSGSFTIHAADFNQDGFADVLLQDNTEGQQTYIVTADSTGEPGQLNAIANSWPNNTLGLNWGNQKSELLTGDFNGDGKVDVLIQGRKKEDQHATVFVDAVSGPSGVLQQWGEDYLGREWSGQTHKLHIGDFNGDGRADIFAQAKFQFVLLAVDDIFVPVPIAPESGHAILLADENGMFTAVHQQWDNSHLGIGDAWMEYHSNVIIADTNGDGRDDIILQGKDTTATHYLLSADATGNISAVTQSWQDGHLNQDWSGSDVSIVPGDFNNDGRDELLLQTASGGLSLIIPDTSGQLTNVSQTIIANVEDFFNTATAFGRLMGEFGVNASGASSYSIPLVVPPGIGGMQPSLSLDYSSQNPNGMLGVGWSLGGLSTIHRCRKNYAQDGEVAGINFDANDRLCLDGQRLIAVQGAYGAVGTEYRTEQDSFSRIIGMGGDYNSVTAWFKVETKSGQILEYGNGSKSQVLFNIKKPLPITCFIFGCPATYAWSVNKIQDAAENYLTVNYHQDRINGEHYPLSIEYTRNDKSGSEIVSPNFKVQFDYQPREDINQGFFSRARTRSTVRLYSIKMTAAGELARHYYLNYEYDINTKFSRITHIVECGANGTCKPATKFAWQNGQRWPVNHTTTSLCPDGNCGEGAAQENRNSGRFIDIDADGYMDICYRTNTGIHCAKGSDTGIDQASVIATGICSDYSDNTAYGGCNHRDIYRSIRYVDVNADGKSDLVFRGLEGLQIILSNGTTFSEHINTGIYPGTLSGFVIFDRYRNNLYFGDLNGDAYPDLCVRLPAGIECRLNTGQNDPGSGRHFFDEAPLPGYTTNICDRSDSSHDGHCNDADNFNSIHLIDMNVDGKADLIFRADGGIRMHLSSGTGFHGASSTTICANGDPHCNDGDNHSTIDYPDINGDRIPDICYRGDAGIRCVLRNAYGYSDEDIIVTDICATGSPHYGQCNDEDNQQTIQYVDINGDGKQDLTFRSDAGIRSFLSTGTGFTDYHATDICRNTADQYRCDTADNNWYTISYPDINGDGLPDLAFRSDSGFRAFLSDGKVPNLLTGITDGFNNQTTITYKPLSDPSVHTRCTDANYPELCNGTPVPVVSEYQASNGVNGMGRYSYQYAGYRMHVRGRGPLGFERVTKIDHQTNLVTSTTWNNRTSLTVQDSYPDTYPYLGMIIETTTSLNNVVLTRVNNTFGYNSSYTGLTLPYFPYYRDSTEVKRDFDSDTDVTTTVTQNVFDEQQSHYAGNLTTVITTTTDNTNGTGYADKVFTKTVRNVFTDIITPDTWQLGRVTSTTVTHKTNSSTIVRESSFDYNANGMLDTTVAEPNDPALQLTTGILFDAYGNQQQVNKSDSTGETRTTTSNYVTGTINSIAPQIETFNALNHSEIKTFDARFGVTTYLLGPNGLPTSWQYDAFGRQLRENRADGTYTRITRARCNSSCLAVGTVTPIYKITTETFGSAPRTTYYDSLDRVLRLETRNVEGKVIYEDTVYDDRGRIEKSSRPYFVGDAIYWTHFSYDTLNRPTTESMDGTGLVKSTSYAPLLTTVTVTNPSRLTADVKNHVKRKYNYANGKLRRVEENKDQTTFVATDYQYDAVGNLTRVDAPNSPPVIMGYDLKGRFKIAMNDPDMGNWSYDHDAFGQLRQQTDALGQVVDMVYDKLGRMTLRLEKEGATVWQYDSASMGIGKLHRVTGPIDLTATQLAAQRANPDAAAALALATTNTFSRTQSYDGYGRPAATVSNIDGTPYAMENSYDLYSRVETVTYPVNIGQPAQPRFATRNVYSNDGFLIRLENAANNDVFWRLGDNTGNITGAVNASGQIESQSYGNGLETIRLYDPADGQLNVISTGSNSLVQNLEYVFDSIGNLEQRLDANQEFIVGNNVVEQFSYDHLNRLKTVTLNGIQTRSHDYDDNGNIIYNSGFGTYVYSGASGPHAVDDVLDANNNVINHYSYDANGNMTGDNTRIITYTSFNKPSRISKGGESSEFYYGPDRARYKQITPTRQVIYLGKLFERETKGAVTKDIHYIQAGGTLIGTYTVYASQAAETRYFHMDHLGSIDVITDENAAVVERLSFSAFGQRRNLDWTYSVTQIFATETTRGFTGHEQLDNVGLIHMNGRVYDPQLGRFLSADPHIQSPDSTQSYNRYTYVNNNPLSYTDPSGYFLKAIHKLLRKLNPLIKIGVIGFISFGWGVGAGIALEGLFSAPTLLAIKGAVGGAVFSGLSGGNIIEGAVFGAAFGFIGGRNWDPFRKAFAHGIVGGTQSQLNGQKFSTGFIAASVAKAVTIGAGNIEGINEFGKGVAAVLSGGLAAKLAGGDFASGASGALFAYLFNQLNSGRNARARKLREERRAKIAAGVHDGHLTLEEAKYWYKNGQGQSIFVDLSKVDFGTVSASDFPNGVGSSEHINLLFKGTNDGVVLGTVRLTLGPNNTVTSDYDIYDFDINWSDGRHVRNILTRIGQSYHGSGTPYNIEFVGVGKIRP